MSLPSEYGLVATCEECGGRAVRRRVVRGPHVRSVVLRCEDRECATKGRIEHETGAGQGWREAADIDGVRDPELRRIEWRRCPECGGSGQQAGCHHPACREAGWCAHDGNHDCPNCYGVGQVPDVGAPIEDSERDTELKVTST